MDQTSMLPSEEETMLPLVKFPLSAKLCENDISESHLKFEKRKNYTSALFDSSVIVRFTSKPFTISVPASFMPTSEAYSCLNISPAKDYIKIKIDTTAESFQGNLLNQLLADVMQNFIDKLPKEFDCCSRYLQCSDAKHCIHPDQDFSLQCGYRKILRSGKIFYGINRNID